MKVLLGLALYFRRWCLVLVMKHNLTILNELIIFISISRLRQSTRRRWGTDRARARRGTAAARGWGDRGALRAQHSGPPRHQQRQCARTHGRWHRRTWRHCHLRQHRAGHSQTARHTCQGATRCSISRQTLAAKSSVHVRPTRCLRVVRFNSHWSVLNERVFFSKREG